MNSTSRLSQRIKASSEILFLSTVLTNFSNELTISERRLKNGFMAAHLFKFNMILDDRDDLSAGGLLQLSVDLTISGNASMCLAEGCKVAAPGMVTCE